MCIGSKIIGVSILTRLHINTMYILLGCLYIPTLSNAYTDHYVFPNKRYINSAKIPY